MAHTYLHIAFWSPPPLLPFQHAISAPHGRYGFAGAAAVGGAGGAYPLLFGASGELKSGEGEDAEDADEDSGENEEDEDVEREDGV